MTQLRQRMLEELQRRNYCSGTIRLYLRHVAEFAQHFHRSPDQLGAEDIRQYQLFLIQEKKLAWSTYNQIVCALRFFYAKTLQRPFLLADIPFTRKPQQLPLILSPEEVAQILQAPPHLKSRALLMTIYAAGLRRSEVARLRVSDIDSARMTITVHQGKGQKDRVVMLSPVLLETLRQYWRYKKPKQWLFPGETPDQPTIGRAGSTSLAEYVSNRRRWALHCFLSFEQELDISMLTPMRRHCQPILPPNFAASMRAGSRFRVIVWCSRAETSAS